MQEVAQQQRAEAGGRGVGVGGQVVQLGDCGEAELDQQQVAGGHPACGGCGLSKLRLLLLETVDAARRDRGRVGKLGAWRIPLDFADLRFLLLVQFCVFQIEIRFLGFLRPEVFDVPLLQRGHVFSLELPPKIILHQFVVFGGFGMVLLGRSFLLLGNDLLVNFLLVVPADLQGSGY